MELVPNPASKSLSVEERWVHVFKAMFLRGDVAAMGAHAFAVYMTIKVHSDLHSGVSYPGVEKISKLSGVSRAETYRALAKLCEMNYLKVVGKHRRSNKYELYERFPVLDEKGRQVQEATVKYAGRTIGPIVSDLAEMAQSTGKVHPQVTIQNLQINITQNNDQSVVLHIQDYDKLPRAIRASLASIKGKLDAARGPHISD